ncbi:MAG: HAMP domain-containing sensor histidine kinase [Myxococcota bacterium]
MASTFEHRTLTVAAASALGSGAVIATTALWVGKNDSVGGILLGVAAALVGLVLQRAGYPSAAARAFLWPALPAVWLATAANPDDGSIGACALGFVVLEVFAMVVLPRSDFVAFGLAAAVLLVALFAASVIRFGLQVDELLATVVGVTFGGAAYGVLGLYAHHLDATLERSRAAEGDARRALETKSAFLANMSHELRTPLNAVLGYGEYLLEDEPDDQGERLDTVGRMVSAGNNLLQLINDLLDLARIESGRESVALERVDVCTVVRAVVEAHTRLALLRRNTLTIEGPASLFVRTDASKIRQILTNLVGNAVKFTEAGAVRVVVSTDGQGVRFTVSDTGIGISRDKLGAVFEPFVQGDLSTTRKYGGTGLGLALVRHQVELLRGEVRCSSVPEVGSTFTVVLPG